MPGYVLLDGAQADLDRIKKYSVANWGVDVAVAYFEGLADIFELIAASPTIGRDRSDDLGNGYISYVHKSHVIYYKISQEHSDVILIVAILHYSMLPGKHLEKR